jgi:septum formation protein
MTKKIILASGSPRRKELLEKAGIVFEVMKSEYEEDMTLSLEPKKLAEHLSLGKAEDVAKKITEGIIISADTFISYEGKIMGKPHTPERAKEMLLSLSGRSHSVITGFTIIDVESGKNISRAVETLIFFKELTEKEIDVYVATGNPLDKAGAYAIQVIGEKWVEKIEGDFNNVVGLPLNDVLETLKDFGINTEQ